MSQAFARLVVQRGPNPNDVFDLIEDKITVGRSPANGIPITDPEISRKHAQFVRQESGYALEDLGSTNGCFVNGRRVTGLTPLHHGDTIDLGEAISLLYVVGAPGDDATMVEGGGSLAEVDTVPEGMMAPVYKPQPYAPPVYTPPAYETASEANAASAAGSMSCGQRVLLGCGGLVFLMFLCVATVYFLDAYDQGRLLYCGALRPFWDLILGPFGFAPICP